MAANDDIDLMQHADGELEEREVAAVESRLASDPDARTKAEAIGQLSELVCGHLELEVDKVSDARFDALWSKIDKATTSKPAPAPARRESGWFERYRGYIFTSVVSAGVVAALALILRGHDSTTTVFKTDNSLEVQPAALRTAPEIEDMDTPDGDGTILNLKDEDGNTTVIWVSPADTVEGI
ncbi:MAG TPA: hypothetical protein VGM39_12220 [Kofleriaceae bacterium]|jgi:anti-sigma factor RsiW